MNQPPVDTTTNEAPRAPQVVVIDISVDTTADGMAELIEQHSGDFFLLSVLPWPGVGARAVFRKHALVARRERQASGALPPYEHPDGKDKAALAILNAHPGKSVRDLSAVLKSNGITRGKDWVLAKRAALSIESGAQWRPSS